MKGGHAQMDALAKQAPVNQALMKQGRAWH
jgi:hypothetical protein